MFIFALGLADLKWAVGRLAQPQKRKKRGKIQAVIDLATSNIPRFSTLLLKKSTAVVMSWNRWKVAARHSTTATSNTYMKSRKITCLTLWLFHHSPPSQRMVYLTYPHIQLPASNYVYARTQPLPPLDVRNATPRNSRKSGMAILLTCHQILRYDSEEMPRRAGR